VLEDLKIGPDYDGFLFLAETVRNPPFLFRSHHHVELELNLVIEGEIIYIVEGKRYRFGKRTLLWFFPSQEHELVDRTADARYYVVVFTPEMIHRACRGPRYEGLKEQEFSESGILHTELEPENFDLVRKSMDALIVDGLDSDLLNQEGGFGLSPDFTFRHHDPDWLNAGLRHLLLMCWRNQQGRSLRTKEVFLHPAVKRSMKLMADSDCRDDLGYLAGQSGVSESYLSRIFHRQVGISLVRYRNSVRLDRFFEYYRRPNTHTVLDAAYAAGFGSYAQFFRVFTETYGEGPRKSFLTALAKSA